MIDIDIHSEDETTELANKIAKALNPSDILLLKGDLGAGKTFFCRQLIRAMMGKPDQEVPSPTFTLLQTYPSSAADIYHFDLYRLSDPEEIYEIGWEDALQDGVILVEWPGRLGYHKDDLLSEHVLDISIEITQGSGEHRIFHISGDEGQQSVYDRVVKQIQDV